MLVLVETFFPCFSPLCVYTTEYTMVSKITYMTRETGSRGILKRKYNIAIKKYIFVDPNIFRKLLARQTIYRVSKYD